MSMTWLFGGPSVKSGKPAPIALRNLRVASPCRMDWTQMSGDDRVRHCSECKLNVYNLSEMSRREAEELIAGHEGRLCVRFYQRADGTVLTRDCPVGLRQLVRKASRLGGAALAALMSMSFCAAQTAPNSGAQAATQNDQNSQNKSELFVTVIDSLDAVLAGVQVTATHERTGKIFNATTDDFGLVDLHRLSSGSYKLEIVEKGFLPFRTSVNIAEATTERITAKLKDDPKAVTILTVGELIAPVIGPRDSTAPHVFDGDLLRAGSPR